MTQTLTLPSLNPIPPDIDEQLRRLLRQVAQSPSPPDPALGDWLLELIKNSGHMSTGDDMRWRVLSMVWLATQFDIDRAWPYLMWLNMNEPVISDHLADILGEALDDLDCHVQVANWIANASDERLVTFFSDFHHIPAVRKMPAILGNLLARPAAAETGIWLKAFCRDSSGYVLPHVRRWCLVAAAWYATCFDPAEGLAYLQQHSNGSSSLSAADNKLLLETAGEFNGTSAMIQWIAACSDPAVKTMLKDFGHPDLTSFAQDILNNPPNYDYLAASIDQAAADARTYKESVSLLEAAGISLTSARILNLACGWLAPQTVLFASTGARATGVDLHIPPAYLPLPGLKYWLKRHNHAKAWRAATAPYYEALARQTGLKLKWGRVKIRLADLTRLPWAGPTFSVVVCSGYLQHAPDVDSLLAEAARVLQPGGLLLADILPFPALTGAFQPFDSSPAWGHLRAGYHHPSVPLNQWREAQYRAAFDRYFNIEQWLAEQDEQAQARLTPDIQTELAGYSADELTRKRLIVLARKK